ncbi:hypothetical protein [Haloarcula salinisoli]|uniref:DUF8048 domain-containing protein n=1 Tax=Haloarcula salinisoli TaxID=2487746 RepID=A0A8J7YLM5_9EURY|nr:hypothetical protein [Halomicroarcula salinisoli]MBX0305469.1 hypothetical protein [Halomicroarcula salinisoli]
MAQERRVHRGQIQQVAAETTVSKSRLTELLEQIADVTIIDDYLEKAWRNSSSTVELAFHNPRSDFVFIIPDSEWDTVFESIDIEEDEATAAKQWHSTRARKLLETSGSSHEFGENHSYLVVPIQDIEVWQRSRIVLSWWFQELAEDGLTPPEVLDYWMTGEMGNAPKEWASQRDVHPEAVRKNVRQAKEKLNK